MTSKKLSTFHSLCIMLLRNIKCTLFSQIRDNRAARYCYYLLRYIGGSTGGPRDTSGPIYFIFMQFSTEILSSNMFSPQTHGLAPPVCKIRHCCQLSGCIVLSVFTWLRPKSRKFVLNHTLDAFAAL